MDCPEYKRLVAEHLKAIAEWKKTFDDGHAWERALMAEVELLKHVRRHKCQSKTEEPGQATKQPV